MLCRQLESSDQGSLCFEHSRGRLLYSVLGEAASHKNSSGVRFTSRWGEEAGHFPAVRGAVRKRGGRGGERPKLSRVLQPFLRHAKEGTRKVEVYPRPQQPRPELHSSAGVQDGDVRGRTHGVGTRRVGNFNRLYRRLFSCSHAQEVQEVPQVLSSRQSVPVCGFANGSLYLCEDIHHFDQGREGFCAEVGDQVAPIHRRLAHTCNESRGGAKANRVGKASGRVFGVSGKHKKVRVSSQPKVCVSRSPLHVGRRKGVHFRGKMGKNAGSVTRVSRESQTEGCSLAIFDRQVGVSRESGGTGDAPCQAFSGRISSTVVSEVGQTTRLGSHSPQFTPSTELVDKERECYGRRAVQEAEAPDPDLHGCVREGLGRVHRCPEQGQGLLGSPRARSSYQCSGNVVGVEGVDGVQIRGSEQSSARSFRQYNDCVVHSEAGGYSVPSNVAGDTGSVPVGRGEQSEVGLQAHSRASQCVGGCSVTGRADSPNRMVASSSDSQRPMGGLGEAEDGLVCDMLQSQDADICFAHPGSQGVRGGCPVVRLDRDPRVCFSSNSHPQSGAKEDSGPGVFGSFDSPPMATACLVPGIARVSSRPSGGVAQEVVPLETATIQSVSSVAGEAESACVVIIEKQIIERGFSARVAARMARPQKRSSRKVYGYRWDFFHSWCGERKINSFKATVPEVAEFLCFLHETKKLAVSTIEGYRTALGHVIRATQKVDLGHVPELTDLISNLARDTTVKRPVLPDWDLSVVLKVLSGEPFEPMHLAHLKFVTFKTVFLLALATGARRSEIHAFRYDTIERQEHGGAMVFYTHPGFVAKTQLANQGGDICKPVVVQALSKVVGPEFEKDRVLCPVRAMKFYLTRTKLFRGDRKRLFVSIKKGHSGDIVRSTLSGWLKKTIVLCYELASKNPKGVGSVKAHSIRAFAASWALHKNCSMDKILQACSWKNHSTFTRFYLRDLTLIRNEMMRLGPLVVAQQLVAL